MSEIKFYCPACSNKLAIDGQAAGFLVNCPKCGKPLKVPNPVALPPRAEVPAPPAAIRVTGPSELLADMARLRAENEQLRKRLETSEQRDAHQLKIESITADLQQRVETLAEAQRRVAQLEGENTGLKQQLKTLSDNFQLRLKELKEKTAEVSRLTEEVRKLHPDSGVVPSNTAS